MSQFGKDTLQTRRTLDVGAQTYRYYSLAAASAAGLGDLARLPFSLKVLLENLLRWEDGRTVTVDDVRAVAAWLNNRTSDREIAFRPARVLMQDFTGVPAVVDLAAMRDAMVARGADPAKINPLVPVDLVIDHSVMVDAFGKRGAFAENVRMEFKRNRERYQFLRWGQVAFDNFRVVPPGTGICHQVNLEYLAQVVWTGRDDGVTVAYPDTLVGTDSHTTMINGLSVLGWGVGGIEAEAAMLGQPISMLIPEVIGFKLTGRMKEGATATDLVLTVTQMLRKKGVVGKFVEFFGPGLEHLTLADQATIGNMAPEYGATCGFFPIGRSTIDYLKFSGRDPQRVALVEAYAKEQGLWRDADMQDPVYTDTLELDLGSVVSSLAGPKRPQDRVPLSQAATEFERYLAAERGVYGSNAAADMEEEGGGCVPDLDRQMPVEGANYALTDGDVVIAAITSCTNTSNPNVLIGAGLLARNARRAGLAVKPWVKTSLAPGSKVVTDYYEASGLQQDLDALGFQLVGYGCTTCIGNSGPLPEPIARAIDAGDLVVVSVLSGNRNFEGRIHPQTRANYLASPPLVVAYGLAGSMKLDLLNEPLGTGEEGQPVYLRDIWPSNKDIQATIDAVLTPEMFRKRYADVFRGDEEWHALEVPKSQTYAWVEEFHLCPSPDLLRADRPGRLRRRLRRPPARHPRRLGDHRPHLARRLDQEGQSGRPLSDAARGGAGGLQLLRLAPRQPRGDGARHLRQHPHPQRDGARHRGRRHPAHAGRRADVDLRRLDEVSSRRRSAGDHRRRRVRHRFVARLGRQGNAAARHQGGDRRELRAHPPVEPRRHGGATAAVRGRGNAQDALPRRQRTVRRHRPRRRDQAADGGVPDGAPSRRQQ